jgi:transposase
MSTPDTHLPFNADLNVSRNIARKYLADPSISSFGGQPVNLPIIEEVENACSSSTHKLSASVGGC